MPCVAVEDLLGGEREVVWACLGCDVYPLGAGFAEERDAFHCGEVDNVEGEVWSQVC